MMSSRMPGASVNIQPLQPALSKGKQLRVRPFPLADVIIRIPGIFDAHFRTDDRELLIDEFVITSKVSLSFLAAGGHGPFGTDNLQCVLRPPMSFDEIQYSPGSVLLLFSIS